jgi:hypothetical protein
MKMQKLECEKAEIALGDALTQGIYGLQINGDSCELGKQFITFASKKCIFT